MSLAHMLCADEVRGDLIAETRRAAELQPDARARQDATARAHALAVRGRERAAQLCPSYQIQRQLLRHAMVPSCPPSADHHWDGAPQQAAVSTRPAAAPRETGDFSNGHRGMLHRECVQDGGGSNRLLFARLEGAIAGARQAYAASKGTYGPQLVGEPPEEGTAPASATTAAPRATEHENGTEGDSIESVMRLVTGPPKSGLEMIMDTIRSSRLGITQPEVAAAKTAVADKHRARMDALCAYRRDILLRTKALTDGVQETVPCVQGQADVLLNDDQDVFQLRICELDDAPTAAAHDATPQHHADHLANDIAASGQSGGSVSTATTPDKNSSAMDEDDTAAVQAEIDLVQSLLKSGKQLDEEISKSRSRFMGKSGVTDPPFIQQQHIDEGAPQEPASMTQEQNNEDVTHTGEAANILFEADQRSGTESPVVSNIAKEAHIDAPQPPHDDAKEQSAQKVDSLNRLQDGGSTAEQTWEDSISDTIDRNFRIIENNQHIIDERNREGRELLDRLFPNYK